MGILILMALWYRKWWFKTSLHEFTFLLSILGCHIKVYITSKYV